MTASELRARIEKLGPGTRAEVVDLTGTQDHWEALVISPAFEGKSMLEQHRMIYALLQAEVNSEEVHALKLRTFTPGQFEKQRG